MKTPKRTYVTNFLEWGDEFQGRLSLGQQQSYARWKRKNRVKQLKRTIARLEKEKEEAYHKGHKAGYDLCFARMMF
jgi:hypothetical protein